MSLAEVQIAARSTRSNVNVAVVAAARKPRNGYDPRHCRGAPVTDKMVDDGIGDIQVETPSSGQGAAGL